MPRKFSHQYLEKNKIIKTDSGCWIWQGALATSGYGIMRKSGKPNFLVHRYFYQFYKGEIRPGLVIDHLCRIKNCVNPHHLEAVTLRENTLRGIGFAAVNAVKKSCLRGHLLIGENLYLTPGGRRQCKACRRRAAAKWQNREVSLA